MTDELNKLAQQFAFEFSILNSIKLNYYPEWQMFKMKPSLWRNNQDNFQLNLDYLSDASDFVWPTTQLPNISVQLYGCVLKQVPEWIKNVENLDYLNLSYNDIEVIPEWLFTRIKMIAVARNKRISHSCIESLRDIGVTVIGE